MKKIAFLLLITIFLAGCGGTVTHPSAQPRQPSSQPTEPEITAPLSAQPTQPPVTVSFPPAGEMLEVECEPFAPLEDNGSRQATIRYADSTSPAEKVATYDLANTEPETDGPVVTLLREYITGALIWRSTPVTDQADREWLLDALERAEFQPVDERLGSHQLMIYVEEDGREAEYKVYADGTLSQEGADGSLKAAYGAVDRDRISALAYKYGSVLNHMGGFPDEWLAETSLDPPSLDRERLPDWWDDSRYPYPPAVHYRLCIQGEGFHADLDREQADIFLTALFGEGHSERAAMPDLIPADVDWTPGENGIRLTERLVAEWTRYEGWAHLKEDRVEHSVYLYPDGTAAFVPMVDPIYLYYTDGVDHITPSWRRVAVAEDAFCGDTLTACLEALGVV